MKKILLLLCLPLAITLPSFAQKKQAKPSAGKVLVAEDRWTFQEGKVQFLDYKGRRVMQLQQQSGPVILKDVVFKDGIIEYDIEPVSTEFANSVYFHRKNEKEQEILYLRVQKIGNKFANEGIQYCPYFDGVNMWDMYPQYQAPAPARAGEWNHIKLVISGKQMHVFVNTKLILQIPKLEGRESEGSIAFEGAAYISNIEIKPGETEGISPAEGADLTKHEANYIRSWAVTQPSFLAVGTEPTAVMDLPKNELFSGKAEAETAGLVNLTRQFGDSEKRRLVWLRAKIITKEPVKTNLQLGFSDEIWVYLNNQLTYVDKNLFTQNMRKYPDGRLSVQNGRVALNLKQGINDLMIGVANDFYGWGIIARLETIDGITEIEPYNPPAKIAIENIAQYPGVYLATSTSVKVTILQKNDELVAQISNREPVPLAYTGNNLFRIESYGVDVIFKPTEKKLIFKQNNIETEFVRE
ncbi:MAG TPA: family 16 glycoside hydrolase [Ohtaekwangia sp.]|uniref:family 16 glycoside hydrolase n=1 Tax=Ohtaekwangia sp. TaxID=2066019 RepID=UPI002F91C998